jgi:pyridoxal phosphate enzyme (YggS family)
MTADGLTTIDIAANLASVRARIVAAERSAGRPVGSVTLVAVSKTHAEAAVRSALGAGHAVFGENRVQEAAAKFPRLRPEFPHLTLHLIGSLQTNKVRDAVALCDVIETLDRSRLALALAKEFARTEKRPALFVEVNTGAEPQKAGVLPDDADRFIAECRETHGLAVAGLMCVPPAEEQPERHFLLLAELARRNGLAGLSMGMSADFEIAIRCGATHVRVGTAIFGARQG